MARGFGIVSPNTRHAVVYRFLSSAFIGLPCPTNTAGIRRSVRSSEVPVMRSKYHKGRARTQWAGLRLASSTTVAKFEYSPSGCLGAANGLMIGAEGG